MSGEEAYRRYAEMRAFVEGGRLLWIACVGPQAIGTGGGRLHMIGRVDGSALRQNGAGSIGALVEIVPIPAIVTASVNFSSTAALMCARFPAPFQSPSRRVIPVQEPRHRCCRPHATVIPRGTSRPMRAVQ